MISSIPIAWDSGRRELRQHPAGLEVVLAECEFVGVDAGKPHRLAGGKEVFHFDADALGYLACRVGRVAREHPVDEQEGESALRNRLLQLLHRDTLGLEVPQERQACRAGPRVVEILQEARRFELPSARIHRRR